MDKLDHLVTAQLIERLLAPERLTSILEALAQRRAEKYASVDERIKALAERVAESEKRLRRLYTLVEDGIAQMDDILKGRISTLKAERDIAKAAWGRVQNGSGAPIALDSMKIIAFGNLMRERLTTGDTPFRKAYLSAIIDRVDVDDRLIKILGRKDVLEQAVQRGTYPNSGVRSFVRKWRSLGESNPSFKNENLAS